MKFLIWAAAAGLPVPANLQTILNNTTNLGIAGDKALLQMEVTVLKNKYLPSTSFDTLQTNAKCLHCADPKALRAATIYVMNIALNGA